MTVEEFEKEAGRKLTAGETEAVEKLLTCGLKLTYEQVLGAAEFTTKYTGSKT